MEFETCYALLGELEIRQGGGSRLMVGRFPYGGLATIADRGRTPNHGYHAPCRKTATGR